MGHNHCVCDQDLSSGLIWTSQKLEICFRLFIILIVRSVCWCVFLSGCKILHFLKQMTCVQRKSTQATFFNFSSSFEFLIGVSEVTLVASSATRWLLYRDRRRQRGADKELWCFCKTETETSERQWLRTDLLTHRGRLWRWDNSRRYLRRPRGGEGGKPQHGVTLSNRSAHTLSVQNPSCLTTNTSQAQRKVWM